MKKMILSGICMVAGLLLFGEENLVGTVAQLGFLVVHHGVGEALYVAGSPPDVGVHYDGCVEADDVVAAVHEVFPPRLLDVVFELNAQRAEVKETVKAAVNFRRPVNKPPAFAKALNCSHVYHKYEN